MSVTATIRLVYFPGMDRETLPAIVNCGGRFDLHGALQRVGAHLEKFGGHTMAAGFTVRRDHFEAFRVAFLAVRPFDGPGVQSRAQQSVAIPTVRGVLMRWRGAQVPRQREPGGE